MPAFTATLLQTECVGPGYFRLELGGCGALAEARAGQFVMLRGPWGSDPLCARAMSLLSVDPSREAVEVLIKVTGRGTALLCGLAGGAQVSVLGPLGNPFLPAPKMASELWCVAGGVGLVPVYFLAAERGPLAGDGAGRLHFYYGARTAAELVLEREVRARAHAVTLATDDGSAGERARITDCVARDLEARSASQPPVVLAACGPEPMFAALARVAKGAGAKVASTQLALEAPMACGYGVCLGCNIPRADGRGYVYVCKDGPVFEASDIYGHGHGEAQR